MLTGQRGPIRKNIAPPVADIATEALQAAKSQQRRLEPGGKLPPGFAKIHLTELVIGDTIHLAMVLRHL